VSDIPETRDDLNPSEESCPPTGSGYPGFLLDPDLLGVPCRFPTVPLAEVTTLGAPTITDTSSREGIPAAVDEPLVAVDSSRVLSLPVYHRAGRAHAVSELLVRSGVAGRLLAAAASLPDGFGFVLLDAWRPLELQVTLHRDAYGDGSLEPGFVALPSSDPAAPSPHLTGGAIDISLTWEGVPLALGTAFDEFGATAHLTAFENRPGRVRDLRRLLHGALTAEGFLGLDLEWWHFEFGTQAWSERTGAAWWYGPVLDPSVL
jgi:D-alanyl-D-alanine dipeptidase